MGFKSSSSKRSIFSSTNLTQLILINILQKLLCNISENRKQERIPFMLKYLHEFGIFFTKFLISVFTMFSEKKVNVSTTDRDSEVLGRCIKFSQTFLKAATVNIV